MRIIDRYLLRQFLQTFLICLFSLTGIFIVFDSFTNLDSLLNLAEKQGSLLSVLVRYYSCRSLWFFDRTLGMLTLTAAMFTIAWIQRHQELTALMAAGIPKTRIVQPVFVASIAVVLIGVANRELLIPSFRDELSRKAKDMIADAPRELTYQYDGNDVFLFGKAGYLNGQRIEKPSFRLPQRLESFSRQIAAASAYYRMAEGDRPAGFLFDGVTHPKDIHLQPSVELDGRTLIVTPHDAPDWLKQNQCFVVTDVTFEQLTNGRAWREFSSTLALIRGLRNRSLDFTGNNRVAIHGRFVQPLLDVTLLFLGLPLLLARGSRNVFFAMGLGGAVVTVFQLVIMGTQRLGSINAISPATAAWVPLMIFVPIAVEMAYSMRK